MISDATTNIEILNIEWVDINSVIPYARNPRKHGDVGLAKVASSIKEYGFRQPIVVDCENVIVAGHARYLAAKRLNMQTIPIHVATNLSDAQIKAYRIADNRTHEESIWDNELLVLELQELEENNILHENKPLRSELHPTMKPVALIERLIKNSSARGDVVLDAFGGSGSTLIACENLNRHARLIELEPKYCDVIIQRWQNLSGEKTINAATGVTYQEAQ